MEYERMDFVEAVHDLAARAGMQVPQTATDSVVVAKGKDLYELLVQASVFTGGSYVNIPRRGVLPIT